MIVPETFRNIGILEVEDKVSQVREIITKLEFDEEFVDWFMADINELLNREDITYGQLYMVRHVTSNILELPLGEKLYGKSLRRLKLEFQEILCRYNFNSFNTYEWLTRELVKYSDETDAGFLPRISRLQKYYELIKVTEGFAYQPQRPKLTQLLSAFTGEKIDEKRAQFQDQFPGEFGKIAKLYTNLSQERLGFLARLLDEVEVFRSGNRKEIARFLSIHVGTIGNKDQEGSSDAIYNSMYSPTLKTVVSVLDIVDKMRNVGIAWKASQKIKIKIKEVIRVKIC